ncbi:pilus assembly protein, partial [Burkholderia pseudomallei]|nr:pilus assembly protein [Burkholderia pseudomallei]MPT71360.1 pilus assembly protein [Burkholderia pseudomallei]MPT86261.1 pilus assembly protein [Burkholderia pseudomallei]
GKGAVAGAGASAPGAAATATAAAFEPTVPLLQRFSQ